MTPLLIESSLPIDVTSLSKTRLIRKLFRLSHKPPHRQSTDYRMPVAKSFAADWLQVTQICSDVWLQLSPENKK